MKRIFLIPLLLLAILTPVPLLSATQSIWLVFRKNVVTRHGTIQPTYLMQIDSAGRVTVPPAEILKPLRPILGPIVFGEMHRGVLDFWANGPRDDRNRFSLYHGVIDVHTWATRSLVVVQSPSLARWRGGLSLTHREGNNLMVVNGAPVMAVELDASGSLDGKYWPLSDPQASSDYLLGGSVSDDGSVFLMNTDRAMVYQHLSSGGIPDRKPIRVAVNNRTFAAASFDITNPLQHGGRMLARWIACNNYDCDYVTEYLLINVLAPNGTPLGKSITIAGDADGPATLWMDPRGRFVIYGISEYRHAWIDLQNPILFQMLDSSGHRAGLPRPILDNVYSFDLLPQ